MLRRAILQIVPHPPGSHEGVGDYAFQLAERLKTDFGKETRFAAAPLESISRSECEDCSDIILHYVNYGYHERGVPMKLPATLAQLKKSCRGKLLTIFHELYASGPPWRSAFWLQPMQKLLARKIARLSDACVVSSETMRDMLQHLAPASVIVVHPVASTVGEPNLSTAQFVRRDSNRWVIFGGTQLVERSLKSFCCRLSFIPDSFSPRELFALGGNENEAVRHTLTKIPSIKSHYHPAVDAGAASDILSSCSFGWIDYFRQRDVPTDVILKSGSFASYCAHGVIPVFPQAGSPMAVGDDPLPGPYYVTRDRVELPAKSERGRIGHEIYNWYTRRASVENLARGIVAALQLGQR